MLLTLGVMTTSMTLILRQLRDRLKEASTELERMAVTDELTGMLNRRAALVRLDEEVSRARRSHAPLSVILIDLDHFKNVNDEFGHAVGDHVLQSVSGRLRKVEREYDVLARYGGEEFLIIAPDTDRDGAVILGERARGQFAEHAVSFPGGSVSVTLSAGVASLLPADSADGLLGRADAALYESKRKGRDCVSPAD
jgi:two-component system cell cycle response regulator